jgi:hypothetical protein
MSIMFVVLLRMEENGAGWKLVEAMQLQKGYRTPS